MLRTVLFPAPFGPSTPVIPALSAQETSFTATTLPYHRDAFRSSMRGGAADAVAGGVDVGSANSEMVVMLRSFDSVARR